MENTAAPPGPPLPQAKGPQPTATEFGISATPPPERRKKERPLWYRALEIAADLRITCVLFVLSFILVFYGTWAQVDAGIWTVVSQYFRGWFVYIPLEIVFLRGFDIPSSIGIPFPGGWTLGSLLMINLLSAHAIRFRMTWRRSGIMVLHVGIILMMVGEFITGNFAVEARMTIPEGMTVNWVDIDRRTELAIVDRVSNPKIEDEVVIPDDILRKPGPINHPELPFQVEVVKYLENSDFRPANEVKEPNLATAGIGLAKVAIPKPETSGVDTNQSIEIASAYVTLRKKSGEIIGTYLVSTWFSFLYRPAEEVEVDGKTYAVSLRAMRSYRPFSVKLNEFHHKKFVGTQTPKDFRSKITLVDKETGESRDTDIYMNHPLRYRGETFYQSGLHPLATGTVLQVVENPAWWFPYVSCILVSMGMMMHFGLMLVEFLQRRLA